MQSISGGNFGNERKSTVHHRPGVRPQLDGQFFDRPQSLDTGLSDTHSLPAGAGLSAEAAAAVPWLEALFPMPADASWPRLMSAVPSRATGTYGWDAVELIEERSGRPLWWGQVLVIVRALEHDAAGELVHRKVCLTEPRQQGKSTVIGEIASWRLQAGEQFGESQEILHIARDVGAAVNVQRPHRLRADREPDRFKVRAAAGRLEIEFLEDGSRWLIRSADGVYSYSSTMAIGDEAWDLSTEVVDDGIAPTLLQRRSSQLWLASTASRRATGLMLGVRAAALAELDSPSSTLWIEWSVPPDADIADPETWRLACPRWTPQIAVRYSDLYSSALSRRSSDPVADDPVEAFACQYLNQWPSSVEAAQARGEPLVDLDAWQAVDIDVLLDAPLVIVVEDNYGTGAALAVAGRGESDPRVHIETELYATRAEALERAAKLKAGYGCSRVLVGATLVRDPQAVELHAKPSGRTEIAVALSLLRELLATGRVTHWADPQLGPNPLTTQIADARVTRSATGALALVNGPRLDALRAALMALHEHEHNRPLVPMIW